VIRHVEERNHGREIASAGYTDLLAYMQDVLENWSEIRQGSKGFWLVRHLPDKHNGTAVIQFIHDDNKNSYRVATMLYSRERSIKNKKLLYTRHPASVISPGPNVNLTPAASSTSTGKRTVKGEYLSEEQSFEETLSQKSESDNFDTYYQDKESGNNDELNNREQMKEVRKQYEGTEQWLKASNGAQSNLNETQWLQVRTPNFKRWFGNWEAASIVKKARDFLENSEAVGSINGDEFSKADTPLVKRVMDFYTNTGNTLVYNKELGNVKLDRRGIKDSAAHGLGKEKSAAFALVPDVIKHGFIYAREKNWKGRGYDTATLIANVKIGGKDYVCEVIVKQSENKQGFYLHEVEVKENLNDVFKTALNDGTSSRSRLIISQYAAEANKASKSVDENGEPLVVEKDGVPVFINDDGQVKSASSNIGSFDTSNSDIYYQEEQDNGNNDELINARTSWPFGSSSSESRSIVEFLSSANKSSGFHELWHHVFRVLTDAALLSDASDLLKHDVGVILKNAGVTWDDFYSNSGDARRTAHEFFAKSGEAYLFEGSAPTPELIDTFERIKSWLVDIYKNIKQALGIELNDEVRDIFNRLLASPEQLAEQKSANDINSLFEATQQEIEFTQEEIERIEAQLADAQAREAMLNEMRDYDFSEIPQNVADAVNDWITAEEHEGEIEEQYSADLNSRKKSVRAKARERIANMTKNAPLIEVNTDTLNALIAQSGFDTAKSYLLKRQEYLDKLLKSLRNLLPAKNAGTAYQRGEIERLQKKRTSLQNKLKQALETHKNNPHKADSNIRILQNEIDKINSKLELLRDSRNNPQSEYNEVKKDISNILSEQKEINEELAVIDRAENADEDALADYALPEVSNEDFIT
ncbi:MAG: hypothetical protein IJ587_11015, partial [Synergistaceae bacterium]|nr:hypothetical protein [Synergistaceae bacterium]